MKRVLSIVLCLMLCLCAMALTVSAETPVCEGQATGHTAGSTFYGTTVHAPCMGGYDVDHYFCTACNAACDDAGNLITAVEPTADHELSDLRPADYTVCGGGFVVEFRFCTSCWTYFDAEGNVL